MNNQTKIFGIAGIAMAALAATGGLDPMVGGPIAAVAMAVAAFFHFRGSGNRVISGPPASAVDDLRSNINDLVKESEARKEKRIDEFKESTDSSPDVSDLLRKLNDIRSGKAHKDH